MLKADVRTHTREAPAPAPAPKSSVGGEGAGAVVFFDEAGALADDALGASVGGASGDAAGDSAGEASGAAVVDEAPATPATPDVSLLDPE